MPFQIGNTEWLKGQQPMPFKHALRMELAALAEGQQSKHPKGSLRWHAQKLCLDTTLNATLAIADRLDGKPSQEIISSGDSADVVRQLRDWLAWTRMPEIIDAQASQVLPDDSALEPKLLECKANPSAAHLSTYQLDPLGEANAD